MKAPDGTVPSGLLSVDSPRRAAEASATPPCIPTGTGTPTYVHTPTPGQRAGAALIHLSTTCGGSTQRQAFVLVTEFSCFAEQLPAFHICLCQAHLTFLLPPKAFVISTSHGGTFGRGKGGEVQHLTREEKLSEDGVYLCKGTLAHNEAAAER